MIRVSKLNLSDIKIESPGQQVKKIILDKFGDIDSFAEKINMGVQTVNKYLKERKLGSKLFKTKLCKTLIMDIDELIKSDKEQIKSMVQNIYDNIEIYKDCNDIYILRKVQELCAKNNLRLEISKMNRNIGMYYFYSGGADRAIDFMEAAISSVKIPSYLIMWKSELALIYLCQCNYKKSRKLHEEIEELLNEANEIDERTMFLHYYRYGLLESNTSNQLSAEKLFRKSLEYAKTSSEIGNALTNIGLSFKLRERYEEAIKYYNKALDIFEDDLNKSRVFNNLAELYKLLGEYNKALGYIQLAFDHIEQGNIAKYFIYYQTYAQIKILMGEYQETISKLCELVKGVEDIFVHRQTVIEGIKTLIIYSKKTDNYSMLEHIQEFLVELIRKTPENYEKYLNDLYACIGDIRLYIITKERSIEEV